MLLHWHRKNQLWLPFGGHIELNEDPVQCVLREVEEESGIVTAVYGSSPPRGFSEPREIAPPVTILIEQVTDGAERHEHIDLIYFCRPLAAPPATFDDPTFTWFNAVELEANEPRSPAPGLHPVAIPEDVRLLALEALRHALPG